jgi:expansin (peptidoglycan-binding protein)
MRLALTGDRRPGPLRPRNGNRIWLVTCIVTLAVAVFVVVKVTGSSCPADPRADGGVAAAGGASPGASGTAASGTDASRTGAGGADDGGTDAGDTAATASAASPAALARPVIEGQAVFYNPGQAAGSCGLGPFPAGGWYASLPPRSYASGRACGSYLDVSGPRGTVRAEVVDVCTQCTAGTVNLSRAAFARIADPRTGLVAVSYRTALDPPLPGPLVLRISATGRSGALAVQVINHGNPLSSVAAGWPGGRWQPLTPNADGYWTGPLRAEPVNPGRPRPGAPPGRAAGARIRVQITDAAGHQVVLAGVSDRSTVLHASSWMYPGRGLAGSRATTLAPATAARSGRHPRPAMAPGSC